MSLRHTVATWSPNKPPPSQKMTTNSWGFPGEWSQKIRGVQVYWKKTTNSDFCCLVQLAFVWFFWNHWRKKSKGGSKSLQKKNRQNSPQKKTMVEQLGSMDDDPWNRKHPWIPTMDHFVFARRNFDDSISSKKIHPSRLATQLLFAFGWFFFLDTFNFLRWRKTCFQENNKTAVAAHEKSLRKGSGVPIIPLGWMNEKRFLVHGSVHDGAILTSAKSSVLGSKLPIFPYNGGWSSTQ